MINLKGFSPVVIGLILFFVILAGLGQFGQAGAMPQAPQSFQPAPQAMVTPSAATTLTVQTINRTGVIPTPIAPNGTAGNKFYNNGNTIMMVLNASGGDTTVSVDIQTVVDGVSTDPKTMTVATGGLGKVMGPFPPVDYNIKTATYKDYVTFLITPTTGVTVYLFSTQ